MEAHSMSANQYLTRFDERLPLLEEALRKDGLRLTHQRLEIFREISEAEDHPSAEMIYKRVRMRVPTISLDTVYRSLATFEEYGLIARIQVFDDHGRFDADLNPHHHLVCNRCRRVVDFRWSIFEDVDLPSQTEEWGRVFDKNVVLRGVCRSCLKGEMERRQPLKTG